jgi:hypothetical protein
MDEPRRACRPHDLLGVPMMLALDVERRMRMAR